MAEESSPAFQFYVKEWRSSRSIMRMSFAERGMYLEMLLEQWENLTLPDDAAAVAELIGGGEAEWRRHWDVLRRRFVTASGGGIYNVRLEKEREKQRAGSERASTRGRAGAAKRWQRDRPSIQQASTQDAQGMSRNSFPIAIPIATATADRARKVLSPEKDTERDALDLRAGNLLNRYAELFILHRQGARYHNRMHLDFPKACELVRTWPDDARLEKLAVLVLTTDDDWISGTDRGFAIFAARATWADGLLAEWEAKNSKVTT